MVHTLKIRDAFAGAVLTGEKPFKVRKNDRGYNAGDIVEFLIINDENEPIAYHPLSGKEYEITYVLSGWGIEKGYVVFGIKEIKK